MIPDSVLHYKIEKKLGEGGMGAVFLATDTKLGRKVAIKLLSSDRAKDPESRQRFIHEAKAEAMLSHPNVVTFHEVGEAEGQAFIVMEYVEGQSLPEYVQSQKLSVSQIIELVIQAGEGLQAAHEKGVIHRDIKPENIMVTSKGHVKLTDFGLARWKGATTITKTGTLMGTVSYMSPEQAEGRKLDHRSDIFSLGVVLYELLCQQRPFEGESEAVVLYEILNAQPQPLARFCRDVPEEMERIMSKCLAKNPAERYQHADDLVADLKRHGTALASAFSGEVATTAVRRRKRTTLLITASSVVVVATILLVIKPWRVAFEPTPKADAGYKMLAVLPFRNIGIKEDEYFADGMTDAIISRLAGVSALRVISYTSSIQYKNTDKTIPQIGQELGVEYILEGTIMWDKSGDTDLVRITPQLIKVDEDFHVWADEIERPYTKLFSVQADIASHITEALNLTLLEPERRSLSKYPTEYPEAYDYFFQAKRLYTYYGLGRMRDIEALLDSAIMLDPGFALAYTMLAEAHLFSYWYRVDHTEARLALAREAVDTALSLDPNLAAAHRVLAEYYYWADRDYDGALERLATAIRLGPSDARSYGLRGYIRRRQGKWVLSMDDIDLAIELDPRNVIDMRGAAESARRMRRWQQWYSYIERELAISPTDISKLLERVIYQVIVNQDLAAAESELQKAGLAHSASNWEGSFLWLDIVKGEYEEALKKPFGTWMVSLLGDFGPALFMHSYFDYLVRGDLLRYSGNVDAAMAQYDSARVTLEDLAQTQPDDPLTHSMLGRMYAGLGQPKQAIQEGELAIEMLPVDHDAIRGADLVQNLATIYILCGEYELALDRLEYLMSIPSNVSVGHLAVWPMYDPLRDHPRFQSLLAMGDKVF